MRSTLVRSTALKISVIMGSFFSLLSSGLAHTGSDQGYYGPGMMWSDGGWMHNGAHMMGYNMYGMGWFGAVFGLAFWVLVGLGLLYIYEHVAQEQGEE